MAQILVTGASGFVGRQLVPALLKAGHKVLCAVTHKVDWLHAEQILVNRMELQEDWSYALRGIDVVIHLAAKVHQMDKNQDAIKDEYMKTNYRAMQNLAVQASEHGVKRFVFLSTIKVNGETTKAGSPFTEVDQPNPSDPYSYSKLEAELYLQDLCAHSTMDYVIIRPPLVYGPEVKANFLKMMQLISKNWPLPFARLCNKRSYIYIDNLVSALLAVIEDKKAANQIYLVADDELLTLPKMMQYLANGMNNKLTLLPIPTSILAFLFQIPGFNHLNTRLLSSLEVSAQKIKTELGWVPPVSALEGLEKTAQWYRYESDS